jgi:ABC-type multidrug transport system ATPase subunit
MSEGRGAGGEGEKPCYNFLMSFPYHEELHIENITVFEKVDFVFSSGINVFIGANGTGKTHAMKLLYCLQHNITDDANQNLYHLINLFQTNSHADILRNQSLVGKFFDAIEPKNAKIGINLSTQPNQTFLITGIYKNQPVFIPSLDMIGHTKKFASTYDLYNIDFDQTHRDIVGLLLSPEKRTLDATSSELLASLEKVMGGTVEEESERFYLKTGQGRHPMPLVADGFKKIATLYQLIKNGLLEPGSTLFWDEPETHLNPILMDELIGVLLKLAQSGVQIFLATHNYVILKELDLQATPEDKVRYFGFEMTANGTQVHATDDYAMLKPNPIMEQFDSIYDRELDRAMGKKQK